MAHNVFKPRLVFEFFVPTESVICSQLCCLLMQYLLKVSHLLNCHKMGLEAVQFLLQSN